MPKLKIIIPSKAVNGIIKISDVTSSSQQSEIPEMCHETEVVWENKVISINMQDGVSNASLSTEEEDRYSLEIYCQAESKVTVEDKCTTTDRIIYSWTSSSTMNVKLDKEAKGVRDFSGNSIEGMASVFIEGNIFCARELNLIGNAQAIVNNKLIIQIPKKSMFTSVPNVWHFYLFDRVVSLLSNFNWGQVKVKLSADDDPLTSISAFNMRFYHLNKAQIDKKIQEKKPDNHQEIISNIKNFLLLNYLEIYGICKLGSEFEKVSLPGIITIIPEQITQYLSPQDIKISETMQQEIIGSNLMSNIGENW